jgi:hypothetical protein
MGITVKNVEIRIHRAKKMLYETLKVHFVPPDLQKARRPEENKEPNESRKSLGAVEESA